MPRTLRFAKLVGAGNDFVLVDARRQRLPTSTADLSRLARQVCDRTNGIGADGLLLLVPSRRADVRMRIFNPDGSEPEMCGNGARCFALFAAQQGLGRQLAIETFAGVIEASVARTGQVSIQLSDPTHVRGPLDVDLGGRTVTIYMVNTGVPHAVVLVPDVRRLDVAAMGQAIRRHAMFAPSGTNVNFVQALGARRLTLRTYERGVEGETLACGTGAVAAAVIGWYARRMQPPIELSVQSGDRLRVSFSVVDGQPRHVILTGPARLICEGTMRIDHHGSHS